MAKWRNSRSDPGPGSWPAEQRTPLDVKTRRGLPPVLIVQSTRDAAPPVRRRGRAAQAVQGLPAHHREGRRIPRCHRTGQPCVNERVDAYLLTGKTDRHDVTCTPHATPKP
ncbi:alpha/beta hydrolase [Streptomyces sp. SM13]|uniref:alpha/beta hydrolase n=1 Tax=Streptomyces sp. SM13 TaxID=1983803 RepID=UPI0035BC1FDE